MDHIAVWLPPSYSNVIYIRALYTAYRLPLGRCTSLLLKIETCGFFFHRMMKKFKEFSFHKLMEIVPVNIDGST